MPMREHDPLLHPSAVIDPGARIAVDVAVGPYSVIGAGVEIEAGCRIGPHVVIRGNTRIGPDNRIFPFATLGEEPQDKKYGGEPTRLEIGRGNTIREHVTINRGTEQDAGVTRVGDDNWIMAGVHIAHDCVVGNGTIMANNTTLAGHVHIGDHAVLGGATLIHQFCRVGCYAFTAYGARINKDVPPFVRVSEGRGRPRGLNSEGLRRHGFSDRRIARLKDAYRLLYRCGLPLETALARMGELDDPDGDIARLCRFIAACRRSIVR